MFVYLVFISYLCTMRNEKDSKDIVQSYLITTAKYKFSPTEKRIMYRVIEASQDLIEGRKLHGHIQVQQDMYRDYTEFTMSYADVLTDDNRHAEYVKKALDALMKKEVSWKDGDDEIKCPLIVKSKNNAKRGVFSFRLDRDIFDAMMLHYEKGFRKYQLETAMGFSSVFSMRLYELISGQKRPLYFKITDLKTMLGVELKYNRPYDFKKWVLNVAKTELDEKADYAFDFIIEKKTGCVKFLPYPIHRGSKAELNRAKRDVSVSWYLPREISDYLKQKGFTTKEIKTHLELFREVCSTLDDPLMTLAEVCAKSREKTNPKGWVINALRGKVNDVKKRQERE